MTNQIIDATDSPDMMRCADYVYRRELGETVNGKNHRWSVAEFAELHGVSHQAVYLWLAGWKKSGLLKAVRREMMVPLGEEVTIARRSVLSAYPELIAEAIHLAKFATKEDVRLEAIKWLNDQIAEPLMAEQPQEGSDEARYLDERARQGPINPLVISIEVEARTASTPESSLSEAVSPE